jgi:hypothetical protein
MCSVVVALGAAEQIPRLIECEFCISRAVLGSGRHLEGLVCRAKEAAFKPEAGLARRTQLPVSRHL